MILNVVDGLLADLEQLVVVEVGLGEHGQPELLQHLVVGQGLAGQEAEAPHNGLVHEDELGEGHLLPALQVEHVEQDYIQEWLHCSLYT